ncbi:hypothetical protein FE784_19710 [Paenibacillus hemerocallicola]|uniref:NodB homology domain-containing protein n=1 Tax=Paenibacillus hemerocallicola TaxID=1172614 RepID=A0A5C4T624_9BACL|nr:hypothetical protein [Paenibacillus hemerocallicola]TNJ64508.1 hypothetical protein FE784_19710 [Paenibacillus hemerocallicola]
MMKEVINTSMEQVIRVIHVIWNEKQAQAVWRQGRDVYTPYLFEILKQAGLAYEAWTPEAWLNSRPEGITLVVGLDNETDWPEVFRSYCESGNALLAVGDTYGLDPILGVRKVRTVKEGWIGWNDSALAGGLQSSFHFFGSTLVQPADGVEAHGSITLRSGTETAHPAVTVKAYPQGAAAMLTVDLARTFCLLQQGVSVVKDGAPSSDGTGAINDDIFKTDDSSVLDWDRDRSSVDGGVPFFLHPIVDEFRILLVRLLHRLGESVSRTFAQVWFWPEGLEAVGHISHDTDGNVSEAAEMLLNRLREAGIKSSWCIIMPGYPEPIYRRILEEGHEAALHYNALEAEGCYWDEALFNEQLAMLKSQLAVMNASVDITMNKNHFLRWEGDVQFYKWCEKAGIVVEQSKGGTKQGNKGFLAGTCHPYLPVSDAAENNRLMNVYSNPTLAWDPPIPIRCTIQEAKAIVDRSKDVYGVAHFLYHPAMFKAHELVGPGFVDLIRYGEELGLPWWTAIELYEWLQLRRSVEVRVEDGSLRISAARGCKGLTVLLSADAVAPEGDSAAALRSARAVERMGLHLQEWVLDVSAGETCIPLHGTIGAAV